MRIKSLLVALSLAVASTAAVYGADKLEKSVTTITVEKMHCAGCAKRIAAQLYKVEGVAEVRVDVKKKLLFIVPEAQAVVSPLGLWEAVELGKDRPIELAGPSGKFKEKPKS